MCRSLGPSSNNSRIPASDSKEPETESGNLEFEKRVHRIHGTPETGLQRMTRSLVAPTTGAGGLIYFLFFYRRLGRVQPGNRFFLFVRVRFVRARSIRCQRIGPTFPFSLWALRAFPFPLYGVWQGVFVFFLMNRR